MEVYMSMISMAVHLEEQSLAHLLWLFFAYSFIGWVLETVFATIKQRKLVNRGLINGPFCIVYGITGILVSFSLQELHGIWLFVFAAVYASVVEWIAGHLIEKVYHERWWNYSDVKWNLDGYICLYTSVLWGALGYIVVRWGNGLLLHVYTFLPHMLVTVILWCLAGMMALDILASYILLKGKSQRLDQWENANNQFVHLSAVLAKWIHKHISTRLKKAYPKAIIVELQKEATGVFAEGCCFYKIAMLFIIGSFLGDITETIFCRLTAGVWMSRSSLIWGPFSIVWGLALAAVTTLLYKYRERSHWFLFWMGTFLGGAYEYLCSVFTEIVFGKVFWDYSALPFNLGGRINLLYCFFWGMAAVVWFKKIYPFLSGLIEKIPYIPGVIVTWGLVLFMCCNILASSMALIRYDTRGKGEAPKYGWEKWMDTHYDDAKMEWIYPNAKVTK